MIESGVHLLPILGEGKVGRKGGFEEMEIMRVLIFKS
jgi:hypothetical protein